MTSAIASSVPEDGEDAAPIATDVTINFTEAIYATTGDEFNGTDAKIEDVISLVDADGEEVDAEITIDGAYMVVTIVPDEELMS